MTKWNDNIDTTLSFRMETNEEGKVAISLNGDLPKERYKNPMNSSEQFQKSFDRCFNQ